MILLSFVLAITATSIVDTANIFHHVSIVKKDQQLFLQLIIIDKADYNEQSTKLLQFLQKNKLKEVFESKLIKLLWQKNRSNFLCKHKNNTKIVSAGKLCLNEKKS